MFWTWLWGTLGLLLSTPLTVCLAVLGKSVPDLRFFAILLGDKADFPLMCGSTNEGVALDLAGAEEVVQTALKGGPRVEVFDQVLIPTLSRAEYDASRGDLDDVEQAFVWDVIGDVIDHLEGVEEFDLASASISANGHSATNGSASPPPCTSIVAIAVEDRADALVLQMLRQLLAGSGLDLAVISDAESSLELAERVAELAPQMVLASHVRRAVQGRRGIWCGGYRARCADWRSWWVAGGKNRASAEAEQLVAVGASHVVFSLAELRDHIRGSSLLENRQQAAAAPLPG